MKNAALRSVINQAGINLAATAITALVAGGVRLAYEKYLDNKAQKRLEAVLSQDA